MESVTLAFSYNIFRTFSTTEPVICSKGYILYPEGRKEKASLHTGAQNTFPVLIVLFIVCLSSLECNLHQAKICYLFCSLLYSWCWRWCHWDEGKVSLGFLIFYLPSKQYLSISTPFLLFNFLLWKISNIYKVEKMNFLVLITQLRNYHGQFIFTYIHHNSPSLPL